MMHAKPADYPKPQPEGPFPGFPGLVHTDDDGGPRGPDDEIPTPRQDWSVAEAVQRRIAEHMAALAAGTTDAGRNASPRDAMMAAITLAMLGRLAVEQQKLDRLREKAERAAQAALAEDMPCLEDFTAQAQALARRRQAWYDAEARRRGAASHRDLDPQAQRAVEDEY